MSVRRSDETAQLYALPVHTVRDVTSSSCDVSETFCASRSELDVTETFIASVSVTNEKPSPTERGPVYVLAIAARSAAHERIGARKFNVADGSWPSG